MTPQHLTERVKKRAKTLGFSSVGVSAAVTPAGIARFDEWLARGYAGEMAYLGGRREAYEHPNRLLDGARSVIVLTLDYRTAKPVQATPGQGRVSRFAWGDADYHDLIRPKLHDLADDLREAMPEATTRGVVDTAPLMERDFAQLAGLGWIGKNTLLLSRERGSYFFLAALVTDAELVPDETIGTDYCGTCESCLDACPTDAFVGPHLLEASRCISYLTIEQKGLPPRELRYGMGDWLFGCDICQEVCPWNRFANEATEPSFSPRADSNPVDLLELFDLDDEAFRQRFKGTPLWRPKRRGLLRNAAIVLGNTRPAAGEAVLQRALDDAEPLVRAAAAWALGQYASPTVREALRAQSLIETDDLVLEEIAAVLN